MKDEDILHHNDLIAACEMVERPKIGIYFLVLRTRIVYVGRAVDIVHRIRQHTRDGKIFDRWTWTACPAQDQPSLERRYLNMLLPDYNRDPLTMQRKDSEHRLGRNRRGARKRADPRPTPDNCYWRGNVLWGRYQIFDKEHRASMRTDSPDEAVLRVASWIKKIRLTVAYPAHKIRHTGTVCDNFAHQQTERNA